MDSVRSVRAVRDYMDRVLTAGALDPSEAITLGRTDAAARISHHLALWHLFQALLDYPDALQALGDTDPVGGFYVARRIRNDLEHQLGVDAVRIVDPYVEVHARAAQGRARTPISTACSWVIF